MIHKKVKFNNTEYWLRKGENTSGGGTLFPIYEYDESGNWIGKGGYPYEHATIYNEKIWRGGSPIGRESDIEFI